MANLPSTPARLRLWLLFGYCLFIVYASLSPFTGWRDAAFSFSEVLQQPLLQTYTGFDALLNVLAYIPLGLLLGLTLRARWGVLTSLLLACCLGLALSASMEFLQMYLPSRTSSNLDLLTNASGSFLGALLALSVIRWTGLYDALAHRREQIFRQGKTMDFGLALLALWMFGQCNPSLPMLGNVFISALDHQPFAAMKSSPFDAWESIAVLLNLLMLGALLLTLLRNKNQLILILLALLGSVALLKFSTAAVLLKSSAILLWVNSEAMLGILLGSVLLVMMRTLNVVMLARVAALISLAYLLVAHGILDSGTPAAAMSIYHWHYGHLLNYNGLAQTITLAFPLLLLLHLWRVRHP
ncbi:MAG: VanZ family protein [Sideroxydans sp.]|nr:VanZ family protein [Sideroxydans sp.]